MLAALAVACLLAVRPAPARAAPVSTSEGGTALDGARTAPLLHEAAPRPGEIPNDWAIPRSARARADTIDFGFYEIRGDGLPYAVRGGIWTWDHGADDPLEGWTSRDLVEDLRDYWRRVTEAIWVAEGNPLPWPDMNGTGIVLCGSREGESDSLGWVAGLGYGNDWCQQLVSPTLTYSGTGTVDLSLRYFNETEFAYDYTRVVLKSPASTVLNSPGFHGSIGIDTLGVISQRTYARTIQNAEFGGGTAPRDFTLVIEFKSDGGLSDEDGANAWDAFYGACGIDDVTLTGSLLGGDVSYDFDADLQGWVPARCPGAGALMGAAPLSTYVIQDPCECALAGNVLEFHNDTFEHPTDNDPVAQHEMAYTCAVDRRTDIGDPAYLDYAEVAAQWDQYSELPQEDGVFYRPGWSYFPWEPPSMPGYQTWSPRIGQVIYEYTGVAGTCERESNEGTAFGLPPDIPGVKFLYEVLSDCSSFGIPECFVTTNFTPIIDNVVVRNILVQSGPPIRFLPGCFYQDGFSENQTGGLSTGDPGWADITFDTRYGDETAPAKLGDSLAITGPTSISTTMWEAKLWLRVKREGPGQAGNQLYLEWKADFLAAKGIGFTPPQALFTWGYMDTCETSSQATRNRYCSQFRDGPSPGGQNLPPDPMFSWGADAGEQDEGNEIIPDLALTPGTKIEYFVTSNYICSPADYYLLPDTTGGNYAEFEILPSFRLAGGLPKFPCVLFIDAFNRGSQQLIEHALNGALNGAGLNDPIPDPTSWDRFDYMDASSNYKATIYREFGGNSGFNLYQVLGYRAMILHTGSFGPGATWARDWLGLKQWLESPLCDGNSALQSLIVDGTGASQIIDQLYPTFLTSILGATHQCDTYSETQCPPGESENDQNFCVRIDPVAGTPFGPGIPSDGFGNWCPLYAAYGVLGTTGTGAGNKAYSKVGSGYATQYAQVINNRMAAPGKYRSCIEDFSYHLLTARDLGVEPDPVLECPSDSVSRVTAVYNEVRNALKWTLNLSDLSILGLCLIPMCEDSGALGDPPSDARVNRLHGNRPNPFNPRTTIRFSLAQDGPAKLVIYDVAGRVVRTLVDGSQEAGLHEVVWDGTNNHGRPVASGVYWCRLSAAEFESNRRMVVVK